MNENIVDIKGTRHGLVILVNPAYDFEEIKVKLQEKFLAAKGFFSGAKVAVQNINKYTTDEQRQLAELCRQNGLIPETDAPTHQRPKPKAKQQRQALPTQSLAGNSIAAEGLLGGESGQNCLLIRQNLRSGQVINYPGHITVLGDVHAGAQLVAGGNILVMGALKGVAHAGATGNPKAVIMAYALNPTQLRIYQTVARAPEHQPQASPIPEIAYLSNNQIVIEEYVPGKVSSLTL